MAGNFTSNDMISESSESQSSRYQDSNMSDVSSGFTESLPSGSAESDSSKGSDQVEADGSNIDSELPQGVEAVPGPQSVTFDVYSYGHYHTGNTKNYRCSAYRRTHCLAKLYVSRLGAVVVGRHKSDCVPEMLQVPVRGSVTFVNWKPQMLLATDEIGIRDVTLTPSQVWTIIRDRCYRDDNVIVQGATKKQILGRLYRTRTNHFGRDIYGRLEMEPLCDMQNSHGLKFFQFHFTYYEDEVLHRAIGYIVNRTNNPLERYNRTLNDAFSVPHPDVIQFISTIEKESCEYVRLINDISNRRESASNHAQPQPAPGFESDSDLADESGSDLDEAPDSDSDDDSVQSMSPEY